MNLTLGAPTPLEFTVRGEVVTAQKLIVEAPKPKARAKPDGQASYHKGFRVEGPPPGSLEAAKESRERELTRWARMDAAEKTECRNLGQKEPKPWDEDHWRRTTALKAVRSRAFEIPDAADQCAALAARAGWLDVRVHEMRRGEEPST